MRQAQLIAFAIAFIVLACSARAQQDGHLSNPLGDDIHRTKVLIGPVVGTGLNEHTGGFRVLSGADCPLFESGTGWGLLAGISSEIQAGATWSIVPSLLFESRPGHFKQNLEDANVLLDSVTVVPEQVSATSDIVYQFISLEVLYSQQLVQLGRSLRLNVCAGPTVGYVLKGKITQVQDLEQPLNAQFVNPDGLPSENNGRRLVYARNQDIPGLAPFRFSLKGGLVAEVGLFHDRWILYPGVYYDLGLSHVTRNENWNLNTVLFEVALRHAI